MSETAITLNVNETALLGLLSEKARYGYELDKIIKERMMREWTDIAFSSIYAVLKGLEGKGCVASAAEIAGNRVRRHYTITRKGRKTLREAVRKTLSEPTKMPDSLMAGVASMSVLPEHEVRQALQARVAALKAQQTLVAEVAAVNRKKDKLYFESLTLRAESRINEDLLFVERLLNAPLEKPEAPKTKETYEPPQLTAETPSHIDKLEMETPAPSQEKSQIKQPRKASKLSKKSKKDSDEQKQTLF